MFYMIGLAALIAILGFLPDQYGLRQKNHKSYLILCGILITLVAGLRSMHAGSGDTYAYALRFEAMPRFETFETFYDTYLSNRDFLQSETGFHWMSWLLARINSEPQTLIFTTSAFVTIATCYFIYKNSANGFLSLLIYICLGLFTFNLNGMRQALAMSVCLFAYEQAKKRNLIRFILLVLLAMQFHKTAICFFPVFILPMLSYSKGNVLLYILGMVIFLLVLDNIILAYNDFTGEEYKADDSSSGGGLFVILIYVFALCISLMQPEALKNRNASIMCYAVILGLAAYVARFFSNQMMERISFYYFYFTILLIPEGIEKLDTREGKIVRWLFIIFALALFSYRIATGEFQTFELCF